MDPENPGQELPIPSQVAVQQPLENNFEGSFDESFWSNHAHERVTDSGRIASDRERDEVQQRITDLIHIEIVQRMEKIYVAIVMEILLSV